MTAIEKMMQIDENEDKFEEMENDLQLLRRKLSEAIALENDLKEYTEMI